MNGQILTNRVAPFDNFRTLNGSEGNEENDRTEKGSKLLQTSIPYTNGLLRSKEGKQVDKMMSLRTIREEDKNETDSSDDEGSATSESDSDSDSSDNSEEPTIEYTFPSHKDNKLEHVELPSSDQEKPVELNGETSFDAAEKEPNTSTSGASGHIGTNGFINNQSFATTNESLSKDLVVSDGSNGNETSTSGSSDVVLGTVSKKGDREDDLHNTIENNSLEKGEVNNSEAISDDSDLNDQTEMLAELKKIVQSDEHLQQSNPQKAGEVKYTSFQSQSLTSDTSANKKWDHGLQGSSQNIPEVSRNSDKFPNSVSLELSGTNMPEGQSDGNCSPVIGSHGNKLTDNYHGDTQGTDQVCTNNSSNNGHDGQGSSRHGNNISTAAKQEKNKLEQSRNKDKVEVKSLSNLENGRDISNKIPRPNPESTVVDGPLKHVEEKLVELEESNKEQTAEIKRLKSENDSLKTSFNKLKESSEYYHDVEGRMLLKRNEELEKHLLGVLKSQEIIFDMKEKLNATTNDNLKLSKDYQEAIKALEAVDKMFGQKDALVKKWKEASEESRRLVELLKKHNAEISDLEQVDQLKEEIANLQEKFLKAEQINEEGNKKNEELQDQSKVWEKKFEYENKQGIKLGCELQAVKRALGKLEKLAAKRGRKNQLLQLEATKLKDTLKLAKDKLVENETRLKEFERKSTSAQEMYTSIIHEKEKQHIVSIKNSEAYQQDLVAKVAEGLKKEIDSLKQTILAFESQKIAMEEKLRQSEKILEENLAKQVEMKTYLETLQPELEKSKITAVDNELYIEEQTVRLQELEEQCRELQSVLQQFIYRGTKRHTRHSSYHDGKHLRPSHTFPTHPNLDMYRKLLAPPKSMPPHRKSSVPREAWSLQGQSDKDKIEVIMNKVPSKVGEPFVTATVHPAMSQQTRPRSTYGNRSLSAANNSSREQTEQNRDWIPKIVLVDSQKLEPGSENDSGSTSISADQYAMEHVKLGEKVLIEMPVEGRKQNLPGVVKYIGPVYHGNFKKGIYAGLKLDIPVGDTNGNIGGRHYFHCLKKHGKFIKLSHILAVQNPRNQQFTRILQMGYK